MATTFYFVRRSGLIERGRKVPAGAIPLFPSCREHTQRVQARARLSRSDNQSLFVPGVPEAETAEEALEAVEDFVNWIVNDQPPGRKNATVVLA
ncbi:MAG: hypothetical protein Q7V31_03605 [Parvibaculum sp.]|uniref:hypothetical protein n=1 Tax=Parvibaculum sp. TaxID=2024848 RepID=UPI00271F2AAA|nr:hypothetical protein [Parvibaculum sp.]MDO8837988.1 hypothetical protein [Parvibaculum sp.]